MKFSGLARREGLLKVHGYSVEFKIYSSTAKDKLTLVLLHEGLGSVSTWRDFPAVLAAQTGAKVLVYSRYGYGHSTTRSKPFNVDYLHQGALQELPAVLQALGIEKPVLFGHSDGASIALIFAGAFPTKLSGLIVEAPHVFNEQINIEKIADIQKVFETSNDLKSRLKRHHKNPESSFSCPGV